VVPVAVRVRVEIPFTASLSEKMIIDPGDKVKTVSATEPVGVQVIDTFCPLVEARLRR
jgi:hypothetical protein